MYVLIGEVNEIYQERIGEPFEDHYSQERIALFDNEKDAKDYIKNSRLKVPKKSSFDSIKPFRNNSLLSRCSDAWVEEEVKEELPKNPTI